MLDDRAIRFAYDQVYTGEKSGYLPLFRAERERRNRSDAADEKTALRIIRYAIEYYLNWDPEYALDHFNNDIIARMKLESAMSYIKYPEEVWAGGDPAYVVSLIYPDKVTYDIDTAIVKKFERVHGSLHEVYPKGFFTDAYGKYRAIVILRYVLTRHYPFETPSAALQFFFSKESKAFLEEYGLLKACQKNFTFNIDFLYAAFDADLRKKYEPLYLKLRKVLEDKKALKELLSDKPNKSKSTSQNASEEKEEV